MPRAARALLSGVRCRDGPRRQVARLRESDLSVADRGTARVTGPAPAVSAPAEDPGVAFIGCPPDSRASLFTFYFSFLTYSEVSP